MKPMTKRARPPEPADPRHRIGDANVTSNFTGDGTENKACTHCFPATPDQSQPFSVVVGHS